MSSKKLALITKVEAVHPHHNAMRLEILEVSGWRVIVPKNIFSLGEDVLFIEVDSLIHMESEWINKDLFRGCKIVEDYYLVSTVKIRDLYSQGMVFKLSDIEDKLGELPRDSKELCLKLGIKRYIKPDIDDHVAIRTFPDHLYPRSHEKRIQSYPEILNLMLYKEYWATLKIDGTSATYHYSDGKITISSRNQVRGIVDVSEEDEIMETKDLYINYLYSSGLDRVLEANPDIVLQGELYGTGIGKNRLNVDGHRFSIFHIFDLGRRHAWSYDKMYSFCQDKGLEVVPLIKHGILKESISELLEFSRGLYPGTSNHREGLVYRNIDNSLSFKVINPDYLIKK